MSIMAALFNHVTPMQIFLQKGWLNSLFAYLGGMSTVLHVNSERFCYIIYTAEYLCHDFNNLQAENYCLHFSSCEVALLIIMIILRLSPSVNTL